MIADLERLPHAFRWRVVCGLTGTGKSRLLRALARARRAGARPRSARGAPRLGARQPAGRAAADAEDVRQPALASARRVSRPTRPVFVEAESRKIGELRVPDALIDAMWESECVVLDAPCAVRVELLKQEYRHFIAQPEALGRKPRVPGAAARPRRDRDAGRQWRARGRLGRARRGAARCSTTIRRTRRAIAKHYPGARPRAALRAADASDGDSASSRECLAQDSHRAAVEPRLRRPRQRTQ